MAERDLQQVVVEHGGVLPAEARAQVLRQQREGSLRRDVQDQMLM
ncbi:hypothetical protein ACIA3K_26995 [Micromonospora sp. NPDC051543]